MTVTPRRPARLAAERLEARDVPDAAALSFDTGSFAPGPSTTTVVTTGAVVAGSGVGGGEVRTFDPATGAQVLDLYPFGREFTGGVRVAAADFNADYTPDIVVAMASAGSQVVVLDGKTGATLVAATAFDPSYAGGVSVAVGYINRDATPDIVVAAAAGGGPRVSVLDGVSGATLASFYAYDQDFLGGVSVAVTDTNGDGVADIITGAGAGGGPEVKVFDGTTGAAVRDFFAFDPDFRGGVGVAAATGTKYGFADIVTGAGAGGGPEVKVFDGTTGAVARDFFAYDPDFRGGVRVAAADVTGDGPADIVTGAGPGGGPQVNLYDGQTGDRVFSLSGLDAGLGGVDVAAAPRVTMVTVPPFPPVP